MRFSTGCSLLFLSGCAGCDPEAELPAVLDEISAEPAGLWAGQAEGVGSATVPFLIVNEVGASVSGGEVSFVSSGTLSAASAAADATGWAFATVEGSAGAFDVSGSYASASVEGTAFLLNSATVKLGFPAWPAGDSDGPVAAAGNGVVIAMNETVWWYPANGGAGVRVLQLDSDILDMRPTRLDGDGVEDLLVWSGNAVVVLRGRADGGLAFAAGWKPRSGTIGTAYAADLNEDAITDLLVVANGDDSASVAWLEGDGQFGWETTAVYEAAFTVFGVSAEDFDLDGRAEITLLSDDGILRRYANQGDKWQAASQSDFNILVGRGARVFGGLDLTNDDWDDVLVSGPLIDGSGYAAACASPGGTADPVIYDLVSADSPESVLGSYVADGDGDGMPDIFFSTDTSFQRARWSTSAGTFSLLGFSGLPAAEMFAVADLDNDALGDVIFPGPITRSVLATSVSDDSDTAADESVPWKPRLSYSSLFDLALVGDPWAGDWSGDNIVDAIALTTSGGLSVQTFLGTPEVDGAAENIRSAAVELISASAVGLDLAVCGNDVWALVSDAGSYVFHYSVDVDGSLSYLGTVAAPDATQIACGQGENFAAVTVGDFGNITYISPILSVSTEAGTGDVGDATVADLDGDGFGELITVPVGSTVASGDFDGNGLDDLVSSDGTTTTLIINGVAQDFAWGGAVSTGDADGDGVVEAIIHGSGVIGVIRGLGGRAGIPQLAWLPKDVRGRAFVGDLDGNGLPDLFVPGDELDATDDVDWSGTVFYIEAAEPGEVPDDTGDTGTVDTGTVDTGGVDTGSNDTAGGDTGAADSGLGDSGAGDTAP